MDEDIPDVMPLVPLCDAQPEHPNCPPAARVKARLLEGDTLPEDVKKDLQ